jgi:hypothetical protein
MTKATGYGSLTIQRRPHRAHRVSWEMHYGPIPPGLFVLHKCDNRACVRPDHLFLGTHQDNMRDMVAKGRAAAGATHGFALRPERAARGERVTLAKLTAAQVLTIRARYAAGGVRHLDLAQQYGVSEYAVWAILHRRTWRHI